MKKRLLIVLEVEITTAEDYGPINAAKYIAGVLNHLDPGDRGVTVTAYEVKR